MKKHLKIIISVAILLYVIPLAIIINFLLMPSSSSVLYVLSQTYLFDREGWKGATLQLDEKHLDFLTPEDGERIQGYGYSLVLRGYKSIVLKSEHDGLSSLYLLDNKIMVLNDPSSMNNGHTIQNSSSIKNDGAFKSIFSSNESFKLMMENLIKGPLVTEYDCYTANLRVMPSDFSLFDNVKNAGVAVMLSSKAVGNASVDAIHEFDNGKIKGIDQVRDKAHRIQFCDISNFDKVYDITLVGEYTQDEVDAILSTITFD